MIRHLVLFLAMLALLAAIACEPTAIKQDQQVSDQILTDLQNAHPVPKFARSQLRQNLVEIITAQAETTQTTTFFFNMGVREPINSCPSIGFPIPATAQLTNPQRLVYNSSGATLPLVEPTGVYTGDTTGTYVICIDAQARPYAVYWEGFTQTISGPAEWTEAGVQLIGPPSFQFTGTQ